MAETESKSQIVVDPSMAASLSLIKHLASCNKSTRDKSLRLLSKWLPAQLKISDDDMKKLWKGLFYCVWHADKAPVQSELINRLSSLLHILDLPLSLQYFSVFLLTLRREWSGIDGLRLDKFYLLIRRFVNSVFQLLNKNGWDLNLTTAVMGIVEDQTFFANDAKVLGNGVGYHIAAVFLDELKGFLPVNREAVEILFGSFLSVMSKSRDKVLISKITVNVFDVLLKTGRNLLEEKKKSGDDVEDAEMENIGTIGLAMSFAAKFYELGSSTDCFQGNRKILFGLHEKFLKLEKDLEVSGIVAEIPVVKPVDDDEVPQLIPIVTDKVQAVDSGLLLEAPEVVAEGSVGKSSKKNKKVKKGSIHGSKKLKVKGGNDSSDMIIANGESLSIETTNVVDSIDFSESFKSNLQMEFEKVAEEEGLDKNGDTTLYDSPEVTIKKVSKKKRKRVRSGDGDGDDSEKPIPNGHIDAAAKSGGEKSEKKVRFSIKNNLVWKPQSPLPPQSVRIPPSVTPRGSALKKGVPPGPIRQMPTAAKKIKSKKARKVMKSTSPGTKRQRKLQGFSA